jgi:polyisoprenoid-binding protein YceI
VRKTVITVLLSTALSLPAFAEPLVLTLDPDATTITFVLGATMHKVHGAFRLQRGEVSYDPATGEASGELVADARSGDSENRKRDRDMHRKVLESESYPTIVLRPERVDGELPATGTAAMTVVDSMQLHGGAHHVDIPVEVTVDGDAVRLTAEFEVPYVEWGLKDPSKLLLRVAKQVTVSVEARGTLRTEAATPEEAPEGHGGE